MNRRLRPLWLFVAATGLGACGGPADMAGARDGAMSADDASAAGARDLGAADLASQGRPDLPTMPARVPVCARLVDEQGAPRLHVLAQLCSPEVCLLSEEAPDGRQCFEVDRPGEYYFHALGDAELTRADVFFPFPVTIDMLKAGGLALGDDLLMASVRGQASIEVKSGGREALDGDVSLDVPPGSLTLPGFVERGEVAATVVPLGRVDARLLASHPGKPLVALVLVPFGSTLRPDARAGLSLPAPPGLAEGEALTVALADFATARLSDDSDALVQGGRIVTRNDAGLSALGWLVVYRK